MPEKLPGAIAGIDMTSDQFHFVRLDATTVAFEVTPTTLATHIPVGVLMNNPTASGGAEVIVSGVAKLEYAGTVTQGDGLRTDTDARGVSLTVGSSGTSGFFNAAFALESGTSGGVYPVLVVYANISVTNTN